MGSYCKNNYWKQEFLISKLIFDELFLKRRSQLKSTCEGLELSGLLSYIRKYPIFCRKIFVSDLDPLTAQNILDIVVMENEETFEKKQSQFFFLQYVKEADSTKLSDILQFVTGFTRIPPWKMEKRYYFKVFGRWWRENAPRVDGVFQYFISTNCSLKPDIT